MWGEPSCGRQPATATDGLEGDRVCVTKNGKEEKEKEKRRKKLDQATAKECGGQLVLHHENLVLLHNYSMHVKMEYG